MTFYILQLRTYSKQNFKPIITYLKIFFPGKKMHVNVGSWGRDILLSKCLRKFHPAFTLSIYYLRKCLVTFRSTQHVSKRYFEVLLQNVDFSHHTSFACFDLSNPFNLTVILFARCLKWKNTQC